MSNNRTKFGSLIGKLCEGIEDFAKETAPIFQRNDWTWLREKEYVVPTEGEIISNVHSLIDRIVEAYRDEDNFSYWSTSGRIQVDLSFNAQNGGNGSISLIMFHQDVSVDFEPREEPRQHDMFCREVSTGWDEDPEGNPVYDCHCGQGKFPGEY